MYSVQFEHTQKDYKQFLWSHFWRRQFFIIILGIFLVPVVMLLLQEEGDPMGLMIGIGVVLYAVLIMVLFAIIIHRQSVNLYKNRSKETRIVFTEELFLVSSTFMDKPIEQSAPYSVYKKMFVTKDLILLYMNYNIATIIPKASVSSEELDDLILFLKERIPN